VLLFGQRDGLVSSSNGRIVTTGPKISSEQPARIGVNIGDQRWVHEVTLAVEPVPAGDQLGAVRPAPIEVAPHAGELLLG